MIGESGDSSAQKTLAEDRVRFMLETHYQEVVAFWTRTNVFLLVMGGGLAGVVTMDPDNHGFVQLVIALLGLVVAAAWWQVNRMSHYYQARWIEAARGLVSSADGLSVYRKPLGIGNPSGPVHRPSGPAATTMVYLVIAAFAVAWMALAIRALAGLLCGGAS